MANDRFSDDLLSNTIIRSILIFKLAVLLPLVSQICLLSSMDAAAIPLPSQTPIPTAGVRALQVAATQARPAAISSATATVTVILAETLTALPPTITNTPVPTQTYTLRPAATPQPSATKTAPGPGTQELVSLTSPVSPGYYASITVKTNPGAGCSITVYYKSGASKAQGLDPIIADSNGLCSWTWKVGARTTPGTWSISVTTGGVTQRYPLVVE